MRVHAANANALKLSSELLRVFVTGLKQSLFPSASVLCVVISQLLTKALVLMQKLFNVLLLLLKQRVLVKYKQLILKGFFHSYC